ncbi:MAG: YbjN domain-containing protein [Alphaproteobacteria bacterium]
MTQTIEDISVCCGSNPLDSVEDVLIDNNWVYDRTNNEELLVDVSGSVFSYRLCFVWQEHLNALQILCYFDCHISDENMTVAAEALMQLNQVMWMGHFELTQQDRVPCFRYTCLLYDRNGETVYANVQDVVDVCFVQCERYQGVFQVLSSKEKTNSRVLSLAMMDTAGES